MHPRKIAAATKVQERWVDRTLRHLTLEEKIGQMIEVRGIMGYYNANDPDFRAASMPRWKLARAGSSFPICASRFPWSRRSLAPETIPAGVLTRSLVM